MNAKIPGEVSLEPGDFGTLGTRIPSPKKIRLKAFGWQEEDAVTGSVPKSKMARPLSLKEVGDFQLSRLSVLTKARYLIYKHSCVLPRIITLQMPAEQHQILLRKTFRQKYFYNARTCCMGCWGKLVCPDCLMGRPTLASEM